MELPPAVLKPPVGLLKRMEASVFVAAKLCRAQAIDVVIHVGSRGRLRGQGTNHEWAPDRQGSWSQWRKFPL